VWTARQDDAQSFRAAPHPNDPVRVRGTLHWDVLKLYAAVVDGLRKAAHLGIDSIESISWESISACSTTPVRCWEILCTTATLAPTELPRISSKRFGAEQLYDTTGIQTMRPDQVGESEATYPQLSCGEPAHRRERRSC